MLQTSRILFSELRNKMSKKLFEQKNTTSKMFKMWSSSSSSSSQKYFLLYKDAKKSTFVLRCLLFAGTPVLLHSANLCQQVSSQYKAEKETEVEVSANPEVEKEGGSDKSLASRVYTSWVGTFLPYAILIGTTILAVTTYRLIVTNPVKILLSTNHDTVAIVTEKLIRGTKVVKYKPSELEMVRGHKIQAPNRSTPGKFIKYHLNQNGTITSKPLFDSVFGWNSFKTM